MKLFSKFKLIFYLLNLILISFYLLPVSIAKLFFYNDLYFYSQINAEFKVSANHIYVFIIFSLVGFLTYVKLNHLIFLSIYLISISVILELTHLLIPYRGFEFADLFGNIIGALIGLIISFFYKKI
jgi:VanZ family protein